MGDPLIMKGNAKYGLLAAGLLVAALLAVTSFYNEGSVDQDDASVVIHEQSSEVPAVKGAKAQKLLQMIQKRKKQIKKRLKSVLDHKKLQTHYISPALRAEQSRKVKRNAKRTKKQMAPAVKALGLHKALKVGKHNVRPTSDRKAKNIANAELATWISRYSHAHPRLNKKTVVKASTPFLKQKVASGRRWQKQVDDNEFAHIPGKKHKKVSVSVRSAKKALKEAKRDEEKVTKAKAKFKAYEAKVKAKHKAKKAKEAKAKKKLKAAKIPMPPVFPRPALKAEAKAVVEGPSRALKVTPAVINDVSVPPAPDKTQESKAKEWNKKHIKNSAKKEKKKANKKAAEKKKKKKKATKKKENHSTKKKKKKALPPMPPVPKGKEIEMIEQVRLPTLRRIVLDADKESRVPEFENASEEETNQAGAAFASDPLGDWD